MRGRDIECGLYARGKIVTNASFWKYEALEGYKKPTGHGMKERKQFS